MIKGSQELKTSFDSRCMIAWKEVCSSYFLHRKDADWVNNKKGYFLLLGTNQFDKWNLSWRSNHNQLGWRHFSTRKQAPPLGLEKWETRSAPSTEVMSLSKRMDSLFKGEQESESKKVKTHRILKRTSGCVCVCVCALREHLEQWGDSMTSGRKHRYLGTRYNDKPLAAQT